MAAKIGKDVIWIVVFAIGIVGAALSITWDALLGNPVHYGPYQELGRTIGMIIAISGVILFGVEKIKEVIKPAK